MFYNYNGGSVAKVHKRKIKKSVYLLFILIIIIIFSIIFINMISNKEEKSVNDDKDISETNKEIENKDKKISLFAVGDVLIHQSVYEDAYENGTYNFHKMFTDIEPIVKKYDLKFCNQESTIGGSALGISGYPSFNSPDEIGDEMVNLGFNLISLANNHLLDKGEDAVLYSNSYWNTKNVITAGSYSSYEEQNEVKVYEKNGIKYAFLAYTTTSNSSTSKGYLINMYSDQKASSDISKIKDKVDLIIVSMHWGEEYNNTPTAEQKRIAEYLSNLGVNVIIGHHPHVIQPVDYVGNTLVIYSLGNFISNQLSIGLNSGIGLMVGVDITVSSDGVKFDNLYKELTLQYADNSTNFKVIPFSKLNDKLLNNYKSVEEDYMKIVNGDER